MGGWRLSACVLTILLGVPSIIARAQDEDTTPRLAIDRLGARSTLPLMVSSEAFAAKDPIPAAYTAEGGNLAPPIFWTPGPRATRSYVVIAEDEDERGGPHRLLWLVYDIPSEQTALGAGARIRVSRQRNGPEIARGKNSLGTIGYAGPRPTLAEGTHTYHFQVFALDTVLHAPDGASLPFVLGAMRGHVIAAGDLAGTFTASRPTRIASDAAPGGAAKTAPPTDEDLPEAPAKPEPVPDAPLKPDVRAADAARAAAPAPPAPTAAADLSPPAQERPVQVLAGQPPAPAAEKPTQILVAQTPPPAPAPAQEKPQALATPTPAPAQGPPEPTRAGQAQTRAPASTARQPISKDNPFDSLLSLFASDAQPMPVAVWVSAYGAQAPKGPPPGAEAPRATAPKTTPAPIAEVTPAQAPTAKPQLSKPPEPDFVPSIFPAIELQPLPTDAWRVASERIGLPAMPDMPVIREEPANVSEATVASAPLPTIAPSPTIAASAQPTVSAPVKPTVRKEEPQKKETAAQVSTAPASKAAPAPPAADLDFLKETKTPAATEPLSRPERVLVADLSFIRLPELPPIEAAPPPPDDVLVPVPTSAPSQPPAALTQPKAKSRDATTAAEPEAESETPAPMKLTKTAPPKPARAHAPAPEATAKPIGLAPAKAPPQATAQPRPAIPSLRPSSGSRSDGAGG